MDQLPIPPFTRETAQTKVQNAEDMWNMRDPSEVAQAISPICVWRNCDEVFQGRAAIEYFLRRKWTIELHYRQMKELWAFTDNRIAVRFECQRYTDIRPRTANWILISTKDGRK